MSTSSSSTFQVPSTPPSRNTAESSISTSSSTPVVVSSLQSSTQGTTTTTSTSISTTAPSSTFASSTSISTSSTSEARSPSASPVASVITVSGSSTVIPGVTSIFNGPGASTYTQFITPTASATPSVASNQSSTSFFSNKGAVAGVFTVVGLIGIALFIAIVTACIRRRRAQQFDMDVAEAAREAAATSAAHHPFADDDYTSYGGHSASGGGRGGGGYTGYSAESHGSYEQPAMSLGSRGGESYAMSDVGAYESRYPSVSAGAAGIGAAVGAAAMQRARSRREGTAGINGSGFEDHPQTQERAPYPAFVAGPAAAAAHNREMFNQSPPAAGSNGMKYKRGPGGPAPDLLEAAGLLGGAAAAAGTAEAQYADGSRNMSQGYGQAQGRGSEEMGYHASASPLPHLQATIPSRESYIGDGPYHVVYPLPPPQQQAHTPEPPTPSDDPFRRNTMPTPMTVPAVVQDDHMEDDAYGGYTDYAEGVHHEESDESRYSELHKRHGEGEGRASFQDEEDYGIQPRVLKVANE